MKSKYSKSSPGLIKIIFMLFVAFAALAFLSFVITGNANLSRPSTLLFGLNKDTVLNSTTNTSAYAPTIGIGAGNIPSSGVNVSKNVSISLNSGNAFSEIQPFSEYITIRNTGSVPINISGWVLKNNIGKRPTEQSNNSYIYETISSAVIPNGNKFLSPEGTGVAEPIVLAPQESAILISGGPFTSYSLPIPLSFKENLCTGYLNSLYPFTPTLENRCPLAREASGVRELTDQCFDYIKTISQCQNPEEDTAFHDYQTRKTRLQLQSYMCQAFVGDHLNYGACVAENKDLPNFYLPTWRVFLGSKTELWSRRADTISLFDSNGTLIAETRY